MIPIRSTLVGYCFRVTEEGESREDAVSCTGTLNGEDTASGDDRLADETNSDDESSGVSVASGASIEVSSW